MWLQNINTEMSFGGEDYAGSFAIEAVKSGLVCAYGHRTVGVKDARKLEAALCSIGFRTIKKCDSLLTPRTYMVMVRNNAIIMIDKRGGGNSNSHYIFVETAAESMDEASNFLKEISAEISKHASEIEKQGKLFTLVSTQAGIALDEIGECTQNSIIRGNYMPDVLEGYDHVISCLTSKDPCGRLVILDGPPGTGKSYMIRALTAGVEAIFVLVAPGLVGQLSGPGVLPALLQARQEEAKCPVVLILEDADNVLSKRETGNNIVGLSEVLNLGDGLMGQMVDVRIVATTNVKIHEMDSAITRPGRMCRRVSIGELTPAKANEIRQSLLNDETKPPFKQGMTLAEVYRSARQDGWEPTKKLKSEVGGNFI